LDEDLVVRFLCHANSTHALQTLWRGLLREALEHLQGASLEVSEELDAYQQRHAR
jgi:hypothetical protein